MGRKVARKPTDTYGFGSLDITDADIATAAKRNRPLLADVAGKMRLDDFMPIFNDLLREHRPLLRDIMAPDSAAQWVNYLPNLSDAALQQHFVKGLSGCKNESVLSNPILLSAFPHKKLITPEQAAVTRDIRETSGNPIVARFTGLAEKLGLRAPTDITPSLAPLIAAKPAEKPLLPAPTKPSAAEALMKASQPVTPPEESEDDTYDLAAVFAALDITPAPSAKPPAEQIVVPDDPDLRAKIAALKLEI